VSVLASIVVPIAGFVGALLHARYGRKVRLKIGDIEAEAQTEEQIGKLLKQAEEFQKRNESKIMIHEAVSRRCLIPVQAHFSALKLTLPPLFHAQDIVYCGRGARDLEDR
jgi:hypothetical protein